jgi:hypothetical protein
MMTDLFPDLGKPTMKSIEISVQIVGGIGSGWSVLGDLTVSPLLLTCITFNHKGVNVLFHTIPEKRTFDHSYVLVKPECPVVGEE